MKDNKQINRKNMIIMGLIGLFIGFIIVSGRVMIVSFESREAVNPAIFVLILVPALILGFIGSRMKTEEKKDEGSINKEKLSKKEMLYIWIFSILSPVITGAVVYYLYREHYPIKARQANTISFICFIPWLGYVLHRMGII